MPDWDNWVPAGERTGLNVGQYKADVRGIFDEAAATYDRSGVKFFTPMGSRLAELVGPSVGDRVLDIGCGRGACLFAMADAVGPNGRLPASTSPRR